MAGMRSETAIDGFRLAYDRSGAGPAALLLHGGPGTGPTTARSSRSWRPPPT